MSNSISSIGILYTSIKNLQGQQSTLSLLNQQLATSKKYTDLTDYDTTSAGRLLNFQNAITQKNGYITAMQTVQTRLDIYDSTMTDMENIAQQATTLAAQSQNYDTSKLSSLFAQAQTYLKQVTEDLNQKLGDRYIYSGIRYSTAPVADLSLVSGAPSTTTVSTPTLPDYDAAYVTSGTTADANAYTQDTINVDAGYSVTYGITSTDASFQKLIAGLRYMKQATTQGTASAYQSDMTTAANLLSSALNGIQTTHAQLASNQNTLKSQTETMNTNITNLQNQISDIKQVDLTEVGTKINFLQTQLSASYSATATLEQLSLLKYL